MARTGPRTSRCPDCNAPFKLQAGQTHYTCGYCGMSFDLGGTQTRSPLPPPPAKPVSPWVLRGVAAGIFIPMVLGLIIARNLIAEREPQEPVRPSTAALP
ncbi:hypothetical protein D7V97_24550, partial [Corallococcus sp. CA053C]